MTDPEFNNNQLQLSGTGSKYLSSELGWIKSTGWSLIFLAFICLGFAWTLKSATQWLLQTILLWWMVVNATSSRIKLNRADFNATPYKNLGWANRLTIFRGLLIAMTGGFIFQEWPHSGLMWLPGILYTMAAVIDRLDGYVARKSGQTSMLGIELDTVFDALGLVIAPLLAVWYGQIHWSYLLFSSAYYLFQWGIYRRKRLGLQIHALRPNIMRRAWAGFQMGFIAVVLLPVFEPPVTTVAGIAFMVPVLVGFMIDWLTVSGRLDRQHNQTADVFARIEAFFQTVLQPLIRTVIIVIMILKVRQPDSFMEMAALLTACMILAGIAGRIAALGLIGLLATYYLTHTFDTTGLVLLTGAVWILLLGTGHYSLWQGDEDWVNRYDGA